MHSVILAIAMSVVLPRICPASAAPLHTTTPAERFYASQGLDSPSALFRDALDTFMTAEAAYRKGNYESAKQALDRLWAAHPPATEEWARAYRQAWDLGRSHGINVGTPPCYYALRMLTECVRWRTSSNRGLRPLATATLRVILVGRSSGMEPTTAKELDAGSGQKSLHVLEPSLVTAGNAIIRDSLWLFTEWVRAASGGTLGVQVKVLHLPTLEVPVAVHGHFAGLAGDAWQRIWNAVPDTVRSSTDWWWVLYPSCVPEQYPDFARSEFITGGMGTGPDGDSPCFIIDDRWLTRKPPHLGKGRYTDIERRAYLPQWLQHEFMHHIFRIYPEFGLEAKDHQWFDRRSWPADFIGFIEPDYYAEAIRKRIQVQAERPLHIALKYVPPPAHLLRRLRLDDLLGEYRHEPMQNDWHVGRLARETVDGHPALRWTNKAGVSWLLRPDLSVGLLRTGPDCPYFRAGDPEASAFRLRLRRDQDGRWLQQVEGFVFGGGVYRKIE